MHLSFQGTQQQLNVNVDPSIHFALFIQGWVGGAAAKALKPRPSSPQPLCPALLGGGAFPGQLRNIFSLAFPGSFLGPSTGQMCP